MAPNPWWRGGICIWKCAGTYWLCMGGIGGTTDIECIGAGTPNILQCMGEFHTRTWVSSNCQELPLWETLISRLKPLVLPGTRSHPCVTPSFPWLTPSNPSELSKDTTYCKKDSLPTPPIPDLPTPVWIGCHSCVLHSIPCWKLLTALCPQALVQYPSHSRHPIRRCRMTNILLQMNKWRNKMQR